MAERGARPWTASGWRPERTLHAPFGEGRMVPPRPGDHHIHGMSWKVVAPTWQLVGRKTQDRHSILGLIHRAVALNWADADLDALNRSAADGLGVQSFAADFGIERRVVFYVDASAMIGVMWRQGAGQLERIAAQ